MRRPPTKMYFIRFDKAGQTYARVVWASTAHEACDQLGSELDDSNFMIRHIPKGQDIPKEVTNENQN